MKKTVLNAYFYRVTEKTTYHGYMSEIEDSFEALKNYIGGRITTYDFTDEIVLVAEEDAVVLGRPLNRVLYNNDGERLAVFAGNLLFVRHEGDKFISLHARDIELIEERFKPIERIFGGKVYLKPVNDLSEWGYE